MAPPPLYSKTVFTVQLTALLSQAAALTEPGTSSLPALAKLNTTLKSWLAAAKEPPAPQSSGADSVVAGSPTSAKSPSCEGPLDLNASGSSSVLRQQEVEDVESAAQATTHAVTLPGSTDVAGRSLSELLTVASELIDAQDNRLRLMARSLLHLVHVRCLSAMREALHYLITVAYRPEVFQLSPPSPSPTAASRSTSSVTSGASSPIAQQPMITLEAVCVHLATIITTSSTALTDCVKLFISHADGEKNLRPTLQVVIDTLKQTYRMTNRFTHDIEKWEVKLHQEISKDDAEESDDGDTDEVKAKRQQRKCSLLEADMRNDREVWVRHVEARSTQLSNLWGTAAVMALRRMGQHIRPIVNFLVSLLPAKGTSMSSSTADESPVSPLTLEVMRSLLAFAPKTTTAPSSTTTASPPQESSATVDVFASASSGGVEAAPPVLGFGAVVLAQMEVSIAGDYLAALSLLCGDDSDGSRAATRIITATLRTLAAESPLLLDALISMRWRRSLYQGILTRIASFHPTILMSALDDLHTITTNASSLSSEIGYLYSGCIFPLLESANCPLHAKRDFILHVLQTFLYHRPTAGGSFPPAPPLMLRFYHAFDLNPHLHELNVVQQFIAVLSRIVRVTPAAQFTTDTEMQALLVKELQERSSSATTNTAGEASREGSPQPPRPRSSPAGAAAAAPASRSSPSQVEGYLVYNQSLPLMALHGLMILMELMGSQIPPESEVEAAASSGALSLSVSICPWREEKQKQQRLGDIFNRDARAVAERFGATRDMFFPPDCEEFMVQFEAMKLPPPASEAAAAAIARTASFIWNTPTLNPEAVTDFITNPDVFSLQVCADVMSRLELRGVEMVDALELLLMTVMLPKEGQRIERLLEYFCSAYFDMNEGGDVDRSIFPFADKDACFLVAVATVMLNTNLHNPMASARMSEESFCGQLSGCNGSANFNPSFTANIFRRIAASPFQSTLLQISSPTLDGAQTRNAVDTLFISPDERRQLAFNAERERVLKSVHRSLSHRLAPASVFASSDQALCLQLSKDLYLSSWSSLSAVFGPAMYRNGGDLSMAVLPKCIRGLQALLYNAAAFGLSTECETMLLSLLQPCNVASVREICLQAVLRVASSPYAVSFSARCWSSVFALMLSPPNPTNFQSPLAEAVLSRVETFSRESLLEREDGTLKEEDENDGEEHADRLPKGSVTPRSTTRLESTAVQSVVSASLSLLMEAPTATPTRVLQHLRILERTLISTSIQRVTRPDGEPYANEKAGESAPGSRTTTRIVHYIHCDGFRYAFLPQLADLLRVFQSNDASLACITAFVTRLFQVLYVHVAPLLAAADTERQQASATLFECFDTFPQIWKSSSDQPLVQYQLISIIQSLSTWLAGGESSDAAAAPGLKLPTTTVDAYTFFSVARRLLSPYCLAFTEGGKVSTAAGIALRKLVTRCMVPSVPTPSSLQLVLLLSNASYIGALCGDEDTSIACVSLVASLCKSVLGVHTVFSSAGPLATATVPTPPGAAAAVSSSTTSHEVMLKTFSSVMTSTHLITHLLERLCLLLRSERSPIRSESVQQLQSLLPSADTTSGALNLRHQLSVVLCHVIVSGAALSSSSPVALTDPVLISFWMFSISAVPLTMRRCSRASFNAAVPFYLRLLTQLLLSCSPQERNLLARFVMAKCLVVLVVSSRSSPEVKQAAASFLAPCAEACAEDAETFTLFIRCLGLILSRYRPCVLAASTAAGTHGELEPAEEPLCGSEWAAEHQAWCKEEMECYSEVANTSLRSLISLSDPSQIMGVTNYQSVMLPSAATPLPLPSGATSPSGTSSPAQSSTTGGRMGATDGFPAAEVVDEELAAEFCGILTSLCPGVPKVLSQYKTMKTSGGSSRSVSGSGESPTLDDDDHMAAASGWEPPHLPTKVCLTLLVEVIAWLFRVFWSTTNPALLETATPPSASNRGGLTHVLPHTAVRGVMNTFFDIALSESHYPIQFLRRIVEDSVTCMEQLQAPVRFSPESSSSTEQRATGFSAYQHIRNGVSGMHHELSVVLSSWIQQLTIPRGVGVAREREIHQMATDCGLCLALLRLLPADTTPPAESLKAYLIWFMKEQKEKETERSEERRRQSLAEEEAPAMCA